MAPSVNILRNGNCFAVMETDNEEDDIQGLAGNLPSPKYTTSDKWIMDQQKRRLLTEKNWALKQQRTQQRITSCSDKLKVCYDMYVYVLPKYVCDAEPIAQRKETNKRKLN